MKNIAESGRSMVEMLAVLAVIGVLSIVGIWGYRYAISKNEANEISEGLSRARVSVITTMGQNINDITISTDGEISEQSETFLTKSHGLDAYDPIGVICTETSFDVALYNINPIVCKRLIESVPHEFAVVDVHNSANENKNEFCRRLDDPANPVVTLCDVAAGDDPDALLRMVFSFEKDGVASIIKCTDGSQCASGVCTIGFCEPVNNP